MNATFNELKDITIGTIPSSYLISLTYEEQVLYLIKICAEIKEENTSINSDIKKMELQLNDLQQRIINFEEYTDKEITELRDELIELINNNSNILRQYINYNVDLLNSKIDDITLENVNVRNPVNGLIENIQKVLDDIYYNGTNGITALNFDNKELTVEEFDLKEITAYDFDRYSNELL